MDAVKEELVCRFLLRFGVCSRKTLIVVDEIGQKIEIVYHCYLIEKTRVLEDLFWKTKGLRALQGGRIRGVVYTLIEIQYPYRCHYFEIAPKVIGYQK